MSLSRGARVRGILFGLALALGLLALTAAVSLPAVVENTLNKVDYYNSEGASEEALELHAKLTVVDMHADTLLWDRDLNEWGSRGHVDVPRLQAGNVAIQVFSSVSKTPKKQNYDSNPDNTDNIRLLTIVQAQPIRTWNSELERSLYHAQKLRDAADASNGKLRLIHDRGELADFLRDREQTPNLVGAIFSVEGLHNLEGDIENIDKLFDAGMRMAGFTHFFDNEVSGSMHGEEKGGLTPFGEKVFDQLEQSGVIIDIAHASEPAVDAMLKRATRPLVSSHGGVQATCDENRNLNDDQIRGVAATGGVVGIGFWDAAVCAPTPQAVVDALDHVVKIGGIETAALGSDFDGAVTTGWDAASMDLITDELLKRGYSDADIALIMGGNTLRVFNDVLPESYAEHSH